MLFPRLKYSLVELSYSIQGCCIQFPSGAYPETVCISPNGHYIVSGSLDGLIEIWDIETGEIKKDLIYQKEVLIFDLSVKIGAIYGT